MRRTGLWVGMIGIVCLLAIGCGPNKTEQLKNGVAYAKGALQQVGVNPLATATWQSIIGGGRGAVDYVNYMLPKKDRVWEKYEEGKPKEPWTIVINPSGAPNEYAIEGYGTDLSKPVVVDYVKITPPAEE